MAKLKIDLHPVYNDSDAIDKMLYNAIYDAINNKIKTI